MYDIVCERLKILFNKFLEDHCMITNNVFSNIDIINLAFYDYLMLNNEKNLYNYRMIYDSNSVFGDKFDIISDLCKDFASFRSIGLNKYIIKIKLISWPIDINKPSIILHK